ncbi:developmentally-regulated external PM-anchored protein [Acrasis kona]|uniref:Developmentally-regulated external PM-anchored protein n=1 Tax=Acrasis kona TaxID=1008807 RepID=A0AAW2YNY4_9EUKA
MSTNAKQSSRSFWVCATLSFSYLALTTHISRYIYIITSFDPLHDVYQTTSKIKIDSNVIVKYVRRIVSTDEGEVIEYIFSTGQSTCPPDQLLQALVDKFEVLPAEVTDFEKIDIEGGVIFRRLHSQEKRLYPVQAVRVAPKALLKLKTFLGWSAVGSIMYHIASKALLGTKPIND